MIIDTGKLDFSWCNKKWSLFWCTDVDVDWFILYYWLHMWYAWSLCDQFFSPQRVAPFRCVSWHLGSGCERSWHPRVWRCCPSPRIVWSPRWELARPGDVTTPRNHEPEAWNHGWLVVWNMFFPSTGNNHLNYIQLTFIFFRGVGQPPTSYWSTFTMMIN